MGTSQLGKYNIERAGAELQGGAPKLGTTSFPPLNHHKAPANGEVGPGPRKPPSRSTAGIRRMVTQGRARDMGTGGGPANGLWTYPMRRGERHRCRPVGKRGGGGAPPGRA